MNRIKTLLCLIFLLPTMVFAGLIEFKGYYQGKNLFLENEFLEEFNDHCITNVYVNSKHLLNHPKERIVEIDLSSFKMGDTLEFRVYHKKGCSPVFMNKNDIEAPTHHFSFTALEVNEEEVHWETKGEEPIGKFSLQQMINGEWKSVKFIKGAGTLSINTYTTSGHHLTGSNTYRVKYRSSSRLTVFSDEIVYQSKKSAVIFYPKRVVDFITFDSDDGREVEFAVHDSDDNLIFNGKGKLIDCRSLAHSQYYTLKYENKEERFYKKEGEIDASKKK